MADYHPDREALEQFARGALRGDDGRWIEDHLRTGCALCQRTVDDLLPKLEHSPAGSPGRSAGTSTNAGTPGGSLPAGRGGPEPAELPIERPDDQTAWDEIFAKLERRLALLSCEKDAAPQLAGEILQQPAPARAPLARSSRRFQTLAVCDLLIEKSFEAGFHDAVAGVELAELGIALAELLDAGRYGLAVVHDVQARAWAHLGNARRLGGDLLGAEEALACAAMLAKEGSADPLEKARLLDLRASLLSDQGWFEEAADVLDGVIDIYDDVQDMHRKGRTLISKGLFLGNAGSHYTAIELFTHGLPLLDQRLEPRLVLAARHNLIWNLNESGQTDIARAQLERFRSSYQELGDARTELPLAWLEARIAARSGNLLEAEQRLGDLRRRFLERGMGYDASLVMLDLALLFLDQGRRDEVRRIPEQMLPILLSRDIHQHAISALIAFQQAAEAGQLTTALVHEIAGYLRRARKNPRLSFEYAA
ncbi:MAG TPA: hypothetical protein VHR45_10045 [Thermoanaerobaculia bacterium]|nr:hypothetical protein [Thermoanaerobaculia bacterium]